jgi:hypothetical protein
MPADFTLDDYLDAVCLFFFPNLVKDHLARAFQQISIADDVVGSQVLQAWRPSSEYALKLQFIIRETEQNLRSSLRNIVEHLVVFKSRWDNLTRAKIYIKLKN